MKQLKVIGVLLVCLLAAITTGLTAEPPQRQQTVTPPVGTDASPTAPAQSVLTWFTNQAAFEEFNKSDGKVLKGFENFEESVLPPNSVDGFNDPLEFGVPNGPDAFPFPQGMTGLPNLLVQSNNLGNDPVDESPHGINGLFAASAGFAGVVSDVVVAFLFVFSLDLIFTEEKSGVGFNTIDLGGPQTRFTVRVFSMDNVFLGMMPSPAEPTGANFIGVWSDVPIGRINIFSEGSEGADNIQAWEAVPCPWDIDGSGSVGASDLLALLASWGPCKGCPADFDGDGNVGASDLLALLVNWGPCP